MGLSAGSLDREIEIWRDVEGEENELGEKPVTDTKIATLWAGMNLFSRDERLAAAQNASILGQRFTVRAEDLEDLEINTKDRVIYNAVTYPIHNVVERTDKTGFDIYVTGVQV